MSRRIEALLLGVASNAIYGLLLFSVTAGVTTYVARLWRAIPWVTAAPWSLFFGTAMVLLVKIAAGRPTKVLPQWSSAPAYAVLQAPLLHRAAQRISIGEVRLYAKGELPEGTQVFRARLSLRLMAGGGRYELQPTDLRDWADGPLPMFSRGVTSLGSAAIQVPTYPTGMPAYVEGSLDVEFRRRDNSEPSIWQIQIEATFCGVEGNLHPTAGPETT